ncbi:hypothetical protein, partial [Chromobacterium violaceum]
RRAKRLDSPQNASRRDRSANVNSPYLAPRKKQSPLPALKSHTDKPVGILQKRIIKPYSTFA